MQKLSILQNQVSYVGLFTRPTFTLWGEGQKILQGLYDAFSSYKVSLADFRNDSSSQVLADQSVVVGLGPTLVYKFKFDRVETVMSAFTDQELDQFPEVMSKGTVWIRSAAPEFAFQTHLFTYHCHSKLSEGTATEFLRGLSQTNFEIPGVGLGNGIIFNWLESEREQRIQLTVDHSHVYPEALFLHFTLQDSTDLIDYGEALKSGKALLTTALERMGLEFEAEEQV